MSGITKTKEIALDTHWKSWKELEDKFGEEAESMAEVLPKRKHPKNPKCFQWLVEEDTSRMAINSFEKHQAAGSCKMDKSSATAMLDAMKEAGNSTDMQLFDKDCALDKHLDDVKELPPWMKKKEPSDQQSVAASSKAKRGSQSQLTLVAASSKGKRDIQSQFTLAQDEQDNGFSKCIKMEGMIRKCLRELEQAEYSSKSSKYKLEGHLKMDYMDSKNELEQMNRQLNKILVQKTASKEKVQEELIKACQLFKTGETILKKVQVLSDMD